MVVPAILLKAQAVRLLQISLDFLCRHLVSEMGGDILAANSRISTTEYDCCSVGLVERKRSLDVVTKFKECILSISAQAFTNARFHLWLLSFSGVWWPVLKSPPQAMYKTLINLQIGLHLSTGVSLGCIFACTLNPGFERERRTEGGTDAEGGQKNALLSHMTAYIKQVVTIIDASNTDDKVRPLACQNPKLYIRSLLGRCP